MIGGLLPTFWHGLCTLGMVLDFNGLAHPEMTINFARPASPRILVASENPLEAQALETMLRAAQYDQVRATTDLRHVPALFIKWRFRLLILDMHAALIDSTNIMTELAEPIRTGEMCVMGLINAGDENARLATLAAGAVGVLIQPLGGAQTLPKIEQVLATMRVDG